MNSNANFVFLCCEFYSRINISVIYGGKGLSGRERKEEKMGEKKIPVIVINREYGAGRRRAVTARMRSLRRERR